MDYLESNALGGTWTCPPIQLRAAPSDILSVEVIAESARLVEVRVAETPALLSPRVDGSSSRASA